MYKDMKNESMQKVVKSKFTALCHLILIMLYSHVKMSPHHRRSWVWGIRDLVGTFCNFLCIYNYVKNKISGGFFHII